MMRQHSDNNYPVQTAIPRTLRQKMEKLKPIRDTVSPCRGFGSRQKPVIPAAAEAQPRTFASKGQPRTDPKIDLAGTLDPIGAPRCRSVACLGKQLREDDLHLSFAASRDKLAKIKFRLECLIAADEAGVPQKRQELAAQFA